MPFTSMLFDILPKIVGLVMVSSPYGSLGSYEPDCSILFDWGAEPDLYSLLDASANTHQPFNPPNISAGQSPSPLINQPAENTLHYPFQSQGTLNRPLLKNPRNLENLPLAMVHRQTVSHELPMSTSQPPTAIEWEHFLVTDTVHAALSPSMGPTTSQTLLVSSPRQKRNRGNNHYISTRQHEAETPPMENHEPSSHLIPPQGLHGQQPHQNQDHPLSQVDNVFVITNARNQINTNNQGINPTLKLIELHRLRRGLELYPIGYRCNLQNRVYPNHEHEAFRQLPPFGNLLLDQKAFIEFPGVDGYNPQKRMMILSWIKSWKAAMVDDQSDKNLSRAGFKSEGTLLNKKKKGYVVTNQARQNLVGSSREKLIQNEICWFEYWENQKNIGAKIPLPSTPDWYRKKAGETYTTFLFYVQMLEVLLPWFRVDVDAQGHVNIMAEAIQVFKDVESEMEWCLEGNNNQYLSLENGYPFGRKTRTNKDFRLVWHFVDAWFKDSKIKGLKDFRTNGGLNRSFKSFFNDLFCYSIRGLSKILAQSMQK